MSDHNRFNNKQDKMTIVEFFFDIRSPFSRIQYELLIRQQNHWKSMTQLRMTPVLIRNIFEASGNLSPAMNPAKLAYLTRDLVMLADYYKVIELFNFNFKYCHYRLIMM